MTIGLTYSNKIIAFLVVVACTPLLLLAFEPLIVKLQEFGCGIGVIICIVFISKTYESRLLKCVSGFNRYFKKNYSHIIEKYKNYSESSTLVDDYNIWGSISGQTGICFRTV